MILKLWQTDPPFNFKGDYHPHQAGKRRSEFGIGTIVQPYQKPHPPIAMSIIRGRSRAAFMAGQRGYIPLSTNIVHASTLNEHWDSYCAGAADAGRPEPDRSNLARVAQHLHRRVERRGLGAGLQRPICGIVRLSAQAGCGGGHDERFQA